MVLNSFDNACRVPLKKPTCIVERSLEQQIASNLWALRSVHGRKPCTAGYIHHTNQRLLAPSLQPRFSRGRAGTVASPAGESTNSHSSEGCCDAYHQSLPSFSSCCSGVTNRAHASSDVLRASSLRSLFCRLHHAIGAITATQNTTSTASVMPAAAPLERPPE